MLNKIMSNEFNKNVVKLMTGTTVAQAIPIVLSPILTRLYTPEDFGVLALFAALTAIFGSIANGRYELAIVLPENENDAINIVALSILIALTLSSVMFFVILLFHENIIKLLGNEQIGIWLYFVPLVVFMIGFFNAMKFYNTRTKNYGVIAQVNVLKSTSLAITQIVMGLFKPGPHGLVIGQLVSHLFSNGKLLKNFKKGFSKSLRINFKEIFRMARDYIDFLKYSMWATLCNTLARNITSIFIPFLYSASTLGSFSLVQRTLGLPTSLIGQAIGQVFIQNASAERKRYGHARLIYISTLKKLFVISLIPFTVLYFAIEDLVVFIFGPNWEMAGVYAKILIPLFLLRFIAAPLNLILTVFEKQRIDLLWQFVFLLLVILTTFISIIFKLKAINFFIIYSVILSLHYMILIFVSYKVSKGNSNRKASY